jgi:hypothetical protein
MRAGALSLPERRFPPPWTVEETDACFIVRDHNGQALAYVYFEEKPGRPRRTHGTVVLRKGAQPMRRRHFIQSSEALRSFGRDYRRPNRQLSLLSVS